MVLSASWDRVNTETDRRPPALPKKETCGRCLGCHTPFKQLACPAPDSIRIILPSASRRVVAKPFAAEAAQRRNDFC
jgi:hypothetical protein